MSNKKFVVKRHRNQKDFKHNSFIVYVSKNKIIVRGRDKKTNNFSKYMEIDIRD